MDGLLFGFIVSKELSLFPGVSYVHATKPGTDLIPDANKNSCHVIGLQFIASYKFNKSVFLFINPTPSILNTNGNWKTYWSGELNLNKIIKPNKLKVNVYWGPNFTNNVNIFRLGATFYL
jgi:hypothetical protein